MPAAVIGAPPARGAGASLIAPASAIPMPCNAAVADPELEAVSRR